MRNKLFMKYPTSWHGDMWREGAPCGSGMVGALVYGGVHSEKIALTHARLWHMGNRSESIPDISSNLEKVRELLDKNDTANAEGILSNALDENGYNGGFDQPIPVCDISIVKNDERPVRNYLRTIDMESATVSVEWTSPDKNGNECRYSRKTFVSRKNDIVFTEINYPDFSVSLVCHDEETRFSYKPTNLECGNSDGYLWLSIENNTGKDYGAVAKIETDGEIAYDGSKAIISNATRTVFSVKTFLESSRKKEIGKISRYLGRLNTDFETQFAVNKRLHKKLFSAVTFNLAPKKRTRTNEQLLLEAYDGISSDELIEKLWSYGRYLFICATREDAPPCNLVGLWSGTYAAFWAINMFNVNYEMIYWQALQNGLPQMLLASFDYIEKYMDDFRENARKVYGCRGININSVNTPGSGLHGILSPHILCWTGAAAWISEHYFDYYLYTLDEEFLKSRAMPFMYETVLFYEDFVIYDEEGYIKFSPSNSPENTPANVMREQHRENEVNMNSTMDFALLRELLTNLLHGAEITGMYSEKVDLWKKMLSKLRPYQTNEFGGIREWMHPYYEDNEKHRHHSHLYPLFPGTEITPEHPLFENFKKANDLRFEQGLNEHSSWGMMYAAGADARAQDGNKAVEKIDIVAQTCIMNNFFTVHNDWRRMGPVMCDDLRGAPFQIDANMGITAAVNEMLLTSREKELVLLPAIPERWKKGSAKKLSAKGLINVDVEWKNGHASAKLTARRPYELTVFYGKEKQTLSFAENETKKLEWTF